MISLRPHHDIDIGGAAEDFLAFGLRHTAGDGDEGGSAVCGAPSLELTIAAKLGIELLRRFFADMAGVDEDHVRAVRLVRRGIAKRPQRVGHSLRVIDVHLTAERPDIKALRQERDTPGTRRQSSALPSIGRP